MKFKKGFFVILVAFSPLLLVAQPTNPSDGPIGGLLYLILTGIGFAVFTLRKKNRFSN